jgi:hypothetical protein
MNLFKTNDYVIGLKDADIFYAKTTCGTLILVKEIYQDGTGELDNYGDPKMVFSGKLISTPNKMNEEWIGHVFRMLNPKYFRKVSNKEKFLLQL